MSVDDNVGDQKRLQEEALRAAQAAAEAGDYPAGLKALVDSRILANIRRRLDFAWGTQIHPIDRDYIVGEAADTYFKAVKDGRRVSNVAAWISKAAMNMATEFHRARQREAGLDEEGVQDRDHDEPRWLTPEQRDARRRRCLEIARSLLPDLSLSDNIKHVMAFFFDAVEKGLEDLPPREIAAALHLHPVSVRKWLERGFKRLTERAKAAGYVREGFELSGWNLAADDGDEDEDEDDGTGGPQGD